MLLVHQAVIMICSQHMNWIKLTFRSRTPIRKWVRKQQCELPALDYMYVFRTYGAPQVSTFVQRPDTPHRHHNHTTLLLEMCVWRGCGVAVVCLCCRSAWCAWSLDEGWHLWATIRTDWASTVPISLQPIASWRWRAWPVNTSCNNWVDLLQAGQVSSVSVQFMWCERTFIVSSKIDDQNICEMSRSIALAFNHLHGRVIRAGVWML